MSTSPLLHKISYYAVLAAIALIFIGSAAMKLTNNETIVNNFTKWNMLEWKNYIAIVEIILVITLFIPKTSLLTVLALSGIMAGALYTHLQYQEPIFLNIAIIVVLWINHLFIKPKKQKA